MGRDRSRVGSTDVLIEESLFGLGRRLLLLAGIGRHAAALLKILGRCGLCLLYTSPSPRDRG